MDLRCFIAVDLTPEVSAALGRLCAELNKIGADARWIPAGNLHLTLKFLGATPEERISGIKAALAAAVLGQTRFTVRFRGMGAFPTARRPRVIWVGIDEGATALAALAREVDRAVGPLGYVPEGRAFAPHLTLARVRSPRGVLALMHEAQKRESEVFGAMEVEGLVLYKSDLLPGGAVYTSLGSFAFPA